MNVLLSIKPRYANAILSGKKTVEFRKAVFKQAVEKVYIYSSSPEKKIIGYFTIESIDEDQPAQLWKKYGGSGSIGEADFFEYYTGKNKGFAIKVKSVSAFETPVDPKSVIENFRAPQSYMYVENIEVQSPEQILAGNH